MNEMYRALQIANAVNWTLTALGWVFFASALGYYLRVPICEFFVRLKKGIGRRGSA